MTSTTREIEAEKNSKLIDLMFILFFVSILVNFFILDCFLKIKLLDIPHKYCHNETVYNFDYSICSIDKINCNSNATSCFCLEQKEVCEIK